MLGFTILEERSSKYNKNIRVVKPWLGKPYMQVNGLTQSGGIVESIWKSTLKKINIDCKKILILGLGGGTLVDLLSKKYTNAKITGVEIDPAMVELGEKYLGLDKNKIKIVIGDALKFKAKNYDLVIVDTYLGDKYVEMKNKIDSKIVIFNRLYYGAKKQEVLEFEKKLKDIYQKVEIFYPQANIMFICYN